MSINPERSVKLRMKVVSPMFMAGAEPRGEPELRPPSLRGALRYWLRALLGAAGLQRVQKFERRLFGFAGDEDAVAGAVSIRIEPTYSLPKQGFTELTRGRQGLAYLWFAARATKKEAERKAILPGAEFLLHLSAPRSADPQRDLLQTLAVLKVATLLGGVGNRSRRFAGAIQVLEVADGDLPQCNPAVRARSAEELAAEIAQAIAIAQIPEYQQAMTEPPEFDVIHPNWCEICVSRQTWEDVLELINEFGEELMNFRREQSDAATFVRAALHGHPIEEVQRPAFGLPIPFYYKGSGTSATLQAEPGFDRRASPIWMQVVRLANGEHAAVFTCFRSRFLPKDAQLVLKLKQEHERELRPIAYGPVPDEEKRKKIIDDFFKRLDLIHVSLA